MKNILVVIGVFFGSFLSLLTLALLLLLVKPELFGGTSQAGANTASRDKRTAPDTVKPAPPDTAGLPAQEQAPTVVHDTNDVLMVQALSQRTRILQSQLDSLRQTQAKKTDQNPASTKDWKTTAQLIESMNAEDAGKILRQMKDDDIKEVLARMKKRQAGKILVLLDPSRAARILR